MGDQEGLTGALVRMARRWTELDWFSLYTLLGYLHRVVGLLIVGLRASGMNISG